MTTPANLAGTPWANTISGYLVYLIATLLVVSIIGAVTWARNINRRLNTQDTALALLVQEVSPAHGTPLRELVNQQAVELATLKGTLGGRVASGGQNDPTT